MLHCATFLLLWLIVTGTNSEETKSPRIIIVGAGASGIAAAAKLLENGFDNLQLIEAENRIGGRVHTVKFDEYNVDLGGQWIHGEVGNIAYELAYPLNLTDHSPDDIFSLVSLLTPTGDATMPVEIMKNMSTVFMQLQDGEYNGAHTNECQTSVGECFSNKLKARCKELEINETVQEQLMWHYSLIQTSYDPADDWFDVASTSSTEEYKLEGDQNVNWKERGYSTILDILMKKIPNPELELPVLNKTILNAEVTKIDYTSEDGRVKVTTANGKEYAADHVIITPSLGVLKAQYETLFSPPLPENKVKNIKGLGFGNACKIILAFNDTWFNPNGNKMGGYSILWTKEDREKFDRDPKTKWMAYALGFYFIEHKPRLMHVWVSGKGARLMDDLTDDEVFEQTKQMLHNLLSKRFNVVMPKAMIRSKWHQNKHFLGTYSYISVETVRTNSSARQLSEPIEKLGKPIILFGGEATNPQTFSTVHGAIGSGWREADRLINLYNKTT